MKKINENETVTVVMDNETLEAMIEDNISIVPKNQRKKFDTLTLEQKAKKIQFYMDMQRMREDARIKNSIPNRVKEMFEKRNATVEDAKTVLQYCTEFIDNFKMREIAKLDEEIARLEEMKRSISE